MEVHNTVSYEEINLWNRTYIFFIKADTNLRWLYKNTQWDYSKLSSPHLCDDTCACLSLSLSLRTSDALKCVSVVIVMNVRCFQSPQFSLISGERETDGNCGLCVSEAIGNPLLRCSKLLLLELRCWDRERGRFLPLNSWNNGRVKAPFQGHKPASFTGVPEALLQ